MRALNGEARSARGSQRTGDGIGAHQMEFRQIPGLVNDERDVADQRRALDRDGQHTEALLARKRQVLRSGFAAINGVWVHVRRRPE